MALNFKTIKNKIKSVKNTKKITKTMEMIAAAKMKKSVDATLNTRLYTQIAADLLDEMSSAEVKDYPLLQNRTIKNILFVLITSNRGLCGGFNGNILKLADSYYNEIKTEGVCIDVLGIGKKSAKFAHRNNLKLIGLFDNITDTPAYIDAKTISKIIIEGYEQKKYDQVVMLYTDFYSSMVQKAKKRKLLPLSYEMVKRIEEETQIENYTTQEFNLENYIFEPGLASVIKYAIPKLLEIQVFQALLESAASEHSARMVAMKNANEAADDMINGLTLEYNKARQAAITKEISEITNGAEALNG
jgi:F-type H+-transporting ATPase subunit gamma